MKNNLIDWRKAVKDIYGEKGLKTIETVVEKIKSKNIKKINRKLSEKDIFVIAYGNSIETETPSLTNVPTVITKYYSNINNIHFLPFFKWTSDDGFSVSDYYEIDERNGKWIDLEKINGEYDFMFDFVVNHSSKSNPWFKKFLAQEPGFEDFYVLKDENFDYSNIIRPRTSPLFHAYEGKEVWSTFSEDQVDLNYKSINVIREVVKLLSFYVSHGMTTVRLDAVGFIWKESGHTGMHHPVTHQIIKMIKSLSFELFGELKIISEVNVPHDENMTYLGDNGNESDEVYNFALPPLMAFTMLTEDASKFKEWMKFFDELKDNETMFNFLASHDGIGQRPIESILTQEEKKILIDRAKQVNGKFNYKSLPNGEKTVYEINSTYVDMIFEDKNPEIDYKKLLLVHALIMYLRGTPAIYFNSLFAKRNYLEGVEKTNENRTINREHFKLETFDENLSALDKKFAKDLNEAMNIRAINPDFNPYVKQKIIKDLDKSIIGFQRGENTYVYANVSENERIIKGTDLKIKPYQILIMRDNEIINSIG